MQGYAQTPHHFLGQLEPITIVTAITLKSCGILIDKQKVAVQTAELN